MKFRKNQKSIAQKLDESIENGFVRIGENYTTAELSAAAFASSTGSRIGEVNMSLRLSGSPYRLVSSRNQHRVELRPKR